MANNTHSAAANRQYQSDLDRQTDLLFWSETRHKVGKRLDPRDPADVRMVPVWLATRARVASSMTPQALRRSAAVNAVFDENVRSGLPIYVYSSGAALGEALIPFADIHQAYSYARARLGDADYVALFETADQKWPDPVFEAFPRRLG